MRRGKVGAWIGVGHDHGNDFSAIWGGCLDPCCFDGQADVGRRNSREEGPISKLAPPDRARAQSLAALTLRHMARLDAILDGFLEHKPPLRALNALRVCAAEIVLDGIPAHGAVNAAVEIVRGSTISARQPCHASLRGLLRPQRG